MAEFGSILLAFSIGTSALSAFSSLFGILKKNEAYIILGRQALFLHFIVITGTIGVLLIMLALPDLSAWYVLNHVNKGLPLFYKLTALWAGQAGSMLFWNFLLVLFSVMAIVTIEKTEPVLIPSMIVILMLSSLFFSLLGNFVESSDPFKVIMENGVAVAVPDGRGLNPLLQHWAMVIHPPILYFGYVSFSIPFAIAMSSLLTKRVNLNWTRLVRRWTLFSWFSLASGIMLGGKWAYEELGWGGYWAWDPVENASLMPWFTGTAFLHSILVQEKRGMMKVWNMILVSLSFLMCIFGTFITRSGVVESVHAFAKSNLGWFFGFFMIAIIVFSAVIIIKRFSLLKSDKPINSFLSREAGFLFNNVLLIVMLFTVILGTMYPVFSELMFDEKVSVTAVWFNQRMIPLGLLLLFLTGAGPLLAWRKTAPATLFKNFFWPTISMVLTFVLFYVYMVNKIGNDSMESDIILSGVTFSISAFVIVGVMEEFIRTTLSRIRFSGENFLVGFILIFFQNKRRYLGYAVHLGLAIMFIGFAGKAFTAETKLTLGKLESEHFNGYMIELANYENIEYTAPGATESLYRSSKLHINVYKDNKLVGSDTTEIRKYKMFDTNTNSYTDGQTTSEPAIINVGLNDVYLQFGGAEENSNRAIIQVWINPLIRLVWIGFSVFTIFLIVLLFPIGENKTFSIFGKKFYITPKPKSDKT